MNLNARPRPEEFEQFCAPLVRLAVDGMHQALARAHAAAQACDASGNSLGAGGAAEQIAQTIAPNLQRYFTGDLPELFGP